MPTLDERINNRKNKKKRTITFKTLSIIFMINIAIGCIFFTDYNMNKNLNKKSIIDMNIELRKWSVEDKEVLIKMCNSIDRSFLSDRLPNPYTNASAEWWLTMVKDNEGKKGVFREIVVDGKIVGTISVEQKDDVYRKDSEIGYYLLQEVYSKGIMSEAVRQICEIAFETLDIIRITGLVYEANIASRKVLERNGFLLEGKMEKAVIKNNNIFDLCIYGKVR